MPLELNSRRISALASFVLLGLRILLEIRTIVIFRWMVATNALTREATSSTAAPTSTSFIPTPTPNSLSSTFQSGITTATVLLVQQSGGGLSEGAIGGIVGGILGCLLLISGAVIFYLLGRRSRTSTPVMMPATNLGEHRKEKTESEFGNVDHDNVQLGGRLRYPDDAIIE